MVEGDAAVQDLTDLASHDELTAHEEGQGRPVTRDIRPNTREGDAPEKVTNAKVAPYVEDPPIKETPGKSNITSPGPEEDAMNL